MCISGNKDLLCFVLCQHGQYVYWRGIQGIPDKSLNKTPWQCTVLERFTNLDLHQCMTVMSVCIYQVLLHSVIIINWLQKVKWKVVAYFLSGGSGSWVFFFFLSLETKCVHCTKSLAWYFTFGYCLNNNVKQQVIRCGVCNILE